MQTIDAEIETTRELIKLYRDKLELLNSVPEEDPKKKRRGPPQPSADDFVLETKIDLLDYYEDLKR